MIAKKVMVVMMMVMMTTMMTMPVTACNISAMLRALFALGRLD